MAASYSSLLNKTFHSLTFLRTTTSVFGKMRGIFKCVCGAEKEIQISSVKSGNYKSCGCKQYGVPKNWIDIIPGEKYARLTLVEDAPRKSGSPNRRVVARCDCGVVKEYFLTDIRTGTTKSCGCIRNNSEIYEKHGHTSKRKFSAEYHTWSSMKTRCSNPKSYGWKEYGGRGVSICQRWSESFEDFLADMGPRPNGMTLDRWPNQDGNYEPGNCRWATKRQQANNTRTNTVLEYDGVKKTVSEWAKEYGLAYNTLLARIIRLKWPIERALKTPPRPSYQR